jgi:hypothetical protein
MAAYTRNPELSQQVIDTLLELPEGGSVVLEEPTQMGCDRLRQALYAWLFHQGIKSEFKVMRETRWKLRVLRKARLHTTAHTVELPLTVAQEFVIECLLDAATEDEALACIRKGVAENKLPEEQINDALEEWRKKVLTGTR